MSTVGTPNAGLDEIGRSAYVNHPAYTLVAYTNTRNSLSAGTLVTNLTTPNVINGYAPILLNGVWTCVNGDLSYTHPGANPFPRWTASGAWSAVVTGVALVYNNIVMHFQDLSTADFAPVNGAWLQTDLQTII